jgi:hypothetical protein
LQVRWALALSSGPLLPDPPFVNVDMLITVVLLDTGRHPQSCPRLFWALIVVKAEALNNAAAKSKFLFFIMIKFLKFKKSSF